VHSKICHRSEVLTRHENSVNLRVNFSVEWSLLAYYGGLCHATFNHLTLTLVLLIYTINHTIANPTNNIV